MGFSLGGSKSSSTTKSAANGENWSASTSIGGGYQGSESTAIGGSQSTAVSQDRLAFEQLYQQLYGGAASAASNLTSNPFLSQTANQLFSSGQNILGGLQNDAGSSYLQSVLSSSGNVDEQIALLGQDINKFTSESLLPNIRRSSAAAGQLGGSRQSVAEGSALQGAQDSFASGASAIRNENLQRQLAAAGQLSAQNLQGAQIGLAGNESLYGLANQGFMSELSPYAALASIYGDKVTLGSSVSQSTSFDEALSQAFGEDFNASNAWSYGYDQATSTTKSKGKSFSLGF
jgi:hypothetical protein